MKRISLVFVVTALLFACSGNKTETVVGSPKSAEAEEVHKEGEETTVSLTEEQIKTAGIQFTTIELKNLQTSIRAIGNLKVPPQNKGLVTSVNSGVLRSLNIHPGSYVRKGQVIGTIVNPDAVSLQRELQTTNAQIALSEIELKRQQELVEGNAAPLKNVQRVQTELATLRVTRNAVTKQLTVMGISAAHVNRGAIVTNVPVTAPISGTIGEIMAQIGSPVDASTPIAQIINNKQLHVDLFVYEKDLPRLQSGQTIHFTLTNNPGKEYDAKIFSVGTAFAPDTRTVPVHAEVLGDRTGLIDGMNITALISIGQSVVPAVPTEAIVNAGGQDYIFVETETPIEEHGYGEKNGHQGAEKDQEHEEVDTMLKEGNHHAEASGNEKPSRYFERVPVQKGASDVGYTEIAPIKEIRPNAVVVGKGAFFLQAKMSNSGEHEH